MLSRKCYTKRISAVFVFAVLCLSSFPIAAQQPGPQNKQGSLSDDDFIRIQQQIKDLKNPTFRAFLRMRLLSWESREPGPVRRQAALAVATQGITDLCDHQDEVWTPTASWLHRNFVKQINTLQSPEESPVEICVLKLETPNGSANDFSSAIKMLSNPETSATGLNLAKTAVGSGQASPHALLSQLQFLMSTKSPHLSELANAVVLLEEKQPGTLPLELMPFFSAVFLDKSVAPEVLTRFLPVAVRASRVTAEELANPKTRSVVRELLNGIVIPAKQLAPELYPEIASRLTSLNANAPNRSETRLAAEERIKNASDQLEQLISEANSTSDEELKTHFFFRAARLAKEKGQLSKAVDLAMKIAKERDIDNDGTTPSWINSFLSEIVSLAVKKKAPADATYAISKMTQTLGQAKAFRLLGEYYGSNQDKVKSKEAFIQSAKQLKLVNSSNEKVTTSLALAESVLQYEPADAYEIFRDSVKAINNLPAPGKDKEKMYYVKLMPIAENLIRSFRFLANHENQTATNLAAEIKLSELRLAALSGAYSGHDVIANAKSHQE